MFQKKPKQVKPIPIPAQILPEQKAQLDVWAIERDKILKDISDNRGVNEDLTKSNKRLAISNTNITENINIAKGRLAEIEKKEKELTTKLSVEVSDLKIQKGKLETEVTALIKEVASKIIHKNDLISTINTLTTMHDQVYSRTSVLNQVVDRVTKINSQNMDTINAMIDKFKKMMVETSDLIKNNKK